MEDERLRHLSAAMAAAFGGPFAIEWDGVLYVDDEATGRKPDEAKRP